MRDNNSERVKTKYGEARLIVGVVDLLGALLGSIGLLWFAFSMLRLFGASDEHPEGALSLIGIAPSLVTMVVGFMMVAHGQLVRASLDTADCTREMLMLAREHNPTN